MSATKVPGRLADVNIAQGVRTQGEAPVALAFGGALGGQQVCGVQRAVNQFVNLLLTERGSVLADPLRGTDFMALLRTGQLYSEAEVTEQFKLASSEVLDYISAQTVDELPDDERLVEAQLLWVTLSPPSLVVGVKLVTAAGNARTVILPLT